MPSCKPSAPSASTCSRVLMAYLKPVMPQLAERAEAFLGETLTWDGIAAPLVDSRRRSFKALFSRIESAKVDAMVEASRKISPRSRARSRQAPGGRSHQRDHHLRRLCQD